MKNSSNSSEEGGNTKPPPKKQCSPSIRWCFTLNNYTEVDYEVITEHLVPKFCKYGLIGKEMGVLETPHLQGYIELTAKGRPMSIFGFNKKIHWEKAKGDRIQNEIYCKKDDEDYWEFDPFKPEPIRTIKREQMFPWQLKILDEIKEQPDDRELKWIWSERGGTGKTSFQKYLVVHHNATLLGGKAADCRNGVVEYKKMNHGNTPKLVCINIPRCFDKKYVSYEAYENIKDMLFYSGKYEGGGVAGNPPHLYIFANIPPDENKCGEFIDRCDIICID